MKSIRQLTYAQALNEALAARVHVLPTDQSIVVYCRGPYSRISDRAIAMLHERGYEALRLAVGFPDWRAAGLPMTTTGKVQRRVLRLREEERKGRGKA